MLLQRYSKNKQNRQYIYMNRMKGINRRLFNQLYIVVILAVVAGIVSCARMGNPDGGWYDETPPKVLGATPADRGTNVTSKNIRIQFDEFIKIENASENVIVSPPQLETPEIKASGKYIDVKLIDSLKPNTTYTVDFSDAISDNNEGNPLGNYTYSFSTGSDIDTMEVSGYVLQAENLEPVKGILVGLYANMADSAFQKLPMLRVSRTDSRGHFVVKGVKPGQYRIYALQDMDGNYTFNQKSEMIAFSHDMITPSVKEDVRQDTTWIDSLHIAAIDRVQYHHYMPDDVVLKAFTEVLTDRYYIKNERQNPDRFTLFFSYGNAQLPQIHGLNFNEKDAFIINTTVKQDTITYWLKDTALVNQDTLRMEMTYLMTDSLGKLVSQTEPLEILSKQPYAKRMREKQKEIADWKKKIEKAKKKGEPFDSIMPLKPLAMDIKVSAQLDPDKNIRFISPTPLEMVDTTKIHLYSKHDSLWYKAPFLFRQLAKRATDGTMIQPDSLRHGLKYELIGEWRPNIEYSLEVDSAAFVDIYGNISGKSKNGFKVKSNDEYSTLLVTLQGMDSLNMVVQLLDSGDKVVKEVKANNGQAEFFYLSPGEYYMRLFVDSNNNGVWDTGKYDEDRQAEEVYYYPQKLECRAKWDITQTWNPKSTVLYRQKPAEITKQKTDKKRTVQHRNAERARKLGKQYIPRI